MEKEVVAGINEEELRALSVEMIERADRISEIFERIEAQMDRLPACYQGPPCAKLIERYRSIKSSFPTIKSNLTSYAGDFTTLIRKMRENDKYLSRLFEGMTADNKSKLKSNNFKLR